MTDHAKEQLSEQSGSAEVIAVLDDGPEVYCASEKAIVAATAAYYKATGTLADAKGLAAALIAAHGPELGLDRSVCLRDLVDAPERSIWVSGSRS